MLETLPRPHSHPAKEGCTYPLVKVRGQKHIKGCNSPPYTYLLFFKTILQAVKDHAVIFDLCPLFRTLSAEVAVTAVWGTGAAVFVLFFKDFVYF